jgi:hypothetical protein
MGCAQDIMTVSQIGGAGLHTLVGTWNYVNESKGSMGDITRMEIYCKSCLPTWTTFLRARE